MDSGTYVQCCECGKWRLVREIEDPSLVPEYWVCSMNQDCDNNDCSKGEGEDSDEEDVAVEHSCGSLVMCQGKSSSFKCWLSGVGEVHRVPLVAGHG